MNLNRIKNTLKKWLFDSRSLVIVSLFVSCCILYQKLNSASSINQKLVSTNETLESISKSNHEQVEQLLGDIYLQNILEGKTLILFPTPAIEKIFQDEHDEFVFVSFGDESCDACVNRLLEDVKKLGELLGDSRIVVLTAYADSRQAPIIHHRLGKRYRVVDLCKNSVQTDSCFLRYPPCLFLMRRNMEVYCLFFYRPNNEKATEYYFRALAKRFKT